VGAVIVAVHPVGGVQIEPSEKARALAEGISEAMNAEALALLVAVLAAGWIGFWRWRGGGRACDPRGAMAPSARPIRVEVTGDIASQLRDMLELIPASMVNVAPERREKLVEELRGVTLRLTPDRTFVAHYHDKTITLSFRVIELLWCVAYAYVVLFDQVYAARRSDDRTPADLTADPVVRQAMELLKWALQDWLDGGGTALPELPKRLPRRLGSAASVADELALCAVAFILHHELAHHRLSHVGIPKTETDPGRLALSLSQEKDADAEAADWILSLVEPTSAFFTKRAAGIIVGLMAIAAYGIHSEEQGGKTHPRCFERFFSVLDRFGLDPNHSAWIFATVALKLHLDHSNYDVPKREYESFRACASAYLDVIAEHERKRA
jgi:hypothetical protein